MRLRRRATGLAVALVAGALAAIGAGPAAGAPGDLTYVGNLVGPGPASMYPVDVATRGSSYYVLDAGRYRVVEVDRGSGAIVAQFGGRQGRTVGRIGAARAVAVDTSGNLYIADTAANRIVKLDDSLSFVTQWGTRGTGAGQFTQDFGVTVGPGTDGSGNAAEVVYVTDGSPGRVQVFTPSGQHIRTFGNGVVDKPRQLTVDPSTGYVYVVSAAPKRVDVFDGTGDPVFSFGGSGSGPGWFGRDPRGVAVFGNRAYVSDPGSQRIQVWNIGSGTRGTYVCSLGGNAFTDVRGIAITGNGRLIAADQWGYGVEEFDVTGVAGDGCGAADRLRSLFGSPPPVPGVNSPRGMDVGGSGRVFVMDWWNQRVQRLTTDGPGALSWGFRGTRRQPGSINFAWDVASQPGTGNVFIANRESHEIEAFRPDGAYLGRFGNRGSAAGQFRFPQGLAFGAGGRLFVADSSNQRIQRCAVSLQASTKTLTLDCTVFAGAGAGGTPSFKIPTGIDVGANGDVWVADTRNSRVVKWDASTGSWTGLQSPDGGTRFNVPWGVTVAPDGTVWVADSGNHRVVQMDPGGSQLRSFTGTDVGAGAFASPSDVVFVGSSVYVSDTWNNRIVELR